MISMNRYVKITSGVIGAAAVAERELVGLRFTNDPRVPFGAVVTIDEAADAVDLFGAGSPEAVFAAQYFGYISPAPVSQAKRLRFASYVTVARAARIYGARKLFTLATFQAITAGSFTLLLGSTSHAVGPVNLAAVLSFADVATAVQTAIRAYVAGGIAWTGATVTYNASASRFEIVGGATGSDTGVGVTLIPGDLGATMGLSDFLAINSPGAAIQTPLEALRKVEAVTDSFGNYSYAPALTLAQALDVATYNAALNVKYQFYVIVTSVTDAQTFYATLKNIASCGLILDIKANEYKEAHAGAILAAIDYDRTNCVVNVMYRQNGAFAEVNDVVDDVTADALDAARTNYYGTSASAGQNVAFFQRGYLCGLASAPVDMNVHNNEQWLKSGLQTDFINAQLALGQIPADATGEAQGLAILNDRIVTAKRNGVIRVGKRLTNLQKLSVTSLTGDPEAWRDVQSNGYWAAVTIVPYDNPNSGVTEYKLVYTLAYAKNDVVRLVEGSHNLI